MSNFNDCWYKDVCTKECSGTCIRYLEMKYLMAHSNIPKHLQTPCRLVPDTCDLRAFETLAGFKDTIDDFVAKGYNMYICSSSAGNGKTSWAIKLLLKYFDLVWPGNGFKTRGVFVHVPTFLLKCKDFNNHDEEFEELKRAILTADLVVWDDIASTDLSSYDFSQLLMYLDNRFASNLSNIYTGNIINEKDLIHALGAKLTSRIFSSKTERITFYGGDKR